MQATDKRAARTGRIKMVSCKLLGLTSVVLVSAILAFPLPTVAGTLDLMPRQSWAKPLTESEMSELRGGFRGIAFSAFVTVENLQNDLTGTINASAEPPIITTNNDQVQIQTVVGNFVGTHGIFQIAQVPGNFNIVNNNLFVQIFVGDLDVAAPSIFGF